MADINPLEMSDEDFAKLNGPPVVEAEATTTADVVAEPTAETVVEEDKSSETVVETTTEDGKTADTDNTGAETGAEASTEGTEGAEGEGEGKVEGEQQAKTDGSETDKGEADPEKKAADEAATTEAPNYEDLYKKLMAPIKANGKNIELRDPEELIKLAQMGADYTRKLQAIAPHRKTILMLENNGLTEDKINFLIDLDKGDPEALKKFIKDKGINVLDIDTESEPAYQPGNHQVSDAEANFKATMEDLTSTPEGQKTVTVIHSNWDDVSKEALWNSPEILTAIHQQREAGPNGEPSIYDQITTEVDRRKTLGQIPAGTPFLQAYKIVGDEWSQKALEAQRVEAEKAKVLGTRAAAPKSTVANGDKANAATPTRAAPKQAKSSVNPLSMSDEEFMKQANFMEGRL